MRNVFCLKSIMYHTRYSLPYQRNGRIYLTKQSYSKSFQCKTILHKFTTNNIAVNEWGCWNNTCLSVNHFTYNLPIFPSAKANSIEFVGRNLLLLKIRLYHR